MSLFSRYAQHLYLRYIETKLFRRLNSNDRTATTKWSKFLHTCQSLINPFLHICTPIFQSKEKSAYSVFQIFCIKLKQEVSFWFITNVQLYLYLFLLAAVNPRVIGSTKGAGAPETERRQQARARTTKPFGFRAMRYVVFLYS